MPRWPEAMRTQLQKDRARNGTRKPGLRKITFSVEALGKISTGPVLQTRNRGKRVIPEHEAIQKYPAAGLALALTYITQGLWSAYLTLPPLYSQPECFCSTDKD